MDGWMDGWMLRPHTFGNVPLRWHFCFIRTGRPDERAEKLGSLISAAILTGAWIVLLCLSYNAEPLNGEQEGISEDKKSNKGA